MNPAIHNPAILPPGTVATPATRPGQAPAPVRGPAFSEVLERASAPVTFSGHALQRVERRGIDVQPAVMARLGEGVDRAAAKGAREAVVLVDGTALVVGVRNRTVITAVGPEHMRQHVFTNIDSAVIA
ncbi:MAG: TIGR02530 family flagellar biosynthesis protein [Actinomycetes bacterium]